MIETLRAVLSECSEVTVAYLFGSSTREESEPSRDLDVAVLLNHAAGPMELGGLATRMHRATGRRVDIADLSLASPVLGMEVVRDGVLLVERMDGADQAFREQAAARYRDTAWLRRTQHEYRSRRAKELAGGSST